MAERRWLSEAWPRSVLSVAVVVASLMLTPARAAGGAALEPVDADARNGAAVLATSGARYTCAVVAGGELKCWGSYLTLAAGGGAASMATNLQSVNLGPGRTARAVIAGTSHICALLDNNGVKCWGSNTDGQLGQGDRTYRARPAALPVVDLGAGRSAVDLAVGMEHTCAVLDNGVVKCWGANKLGQLGLGHTQRRGNDPGEVAVNPGVDLGHRRTAVAVVALRQSTCALLDNGTVKCWGENGYGQLGLGDQNHRGDQPGEMGEQLPPVDFGPGRRAVSLSGGDYHACAVLDDGSVRCWGNNVNGRLGLGDEEARGDNPGEMGAHLPAVDLGPGHNARAVTAGDEHTCALLDDATVKCWGFGWYLGLGDYPTRGDQPGEMGAALPVVDLGPDRTARAVMTSVDHTCALLDDATVKCWGDNLGAELGLVDMHPNIVGDEPGEMGADLPAAEIGGQVFAIEQPKVPLAPPAGLIPIRPVRLFDTRPGEPHGLVAVAKQRIGPGQALRVPAADMAAVDAAAIGALSLNITVVDPAADGYVTVYPCGQRPLVSSVNFRAGQTVPNAVLTPVSRDGEVCVFASTTLDVVADLNGWASSAFGFTPIEPTRLFDTREGEPDGAAMVVKKQYGGPGNLLRVGVAGLAGVPLRGAAAVSLNVTVVNPAGPGYLTVFPCGTRPLASNLNFSSGQVVANAVLAPLSTSGQICVHSSTGVDIVADVAGWFPEGPELTSGSPERLIDSRPSEPDGAVPITKQPLGGDDRILRVQVLDRAGVGPADVSVVSMNVTAVDPKAAGFITVFPCGERPLASNLNFRAGQTVANAVLAPVSSTGEVCFYGSTTVDVVADVNGWFLA